jgi:hypothetical protein
MFHKWLSITAHQVRNIKFYLAYTDTGLLRLVDW